MLNPRFHFVLQIISVHRFLFFFLRIHRDRSIFPDPFFVLRCFPRTPLLFWCTRFAYLFESSFWVSHFVRSVFFFINSTILFFWGGGGGGSQPSHACSFQLLYSSCFDRVARPRDQDNLRLLLGPELIPPKTLWGLILAFELGSFAPARTLAKPWKTEFFNRRWRHQASPRVGGCSHIGSKPKRTYSRNDCHFASNDIFPHQKQKLHFQLTKKLFYQTAPSIFSPRYTWRTNSPFPHVRRKKCLRAVSLLHLPKFLPVQRIVAESVGTRSNFGPRVTTHIHWPAPAIRIKTKKLGLEKNTKWWGERINIHTPRSTIAFMCRGGYVGRWEDGVDISLP